MELKLKEIAEAVKGRYCGDASDGDRMITGVVTDSRQVEPGNLFIAIRGERSDGHRYIPDVFEKGAAAVFAEEELADPKGPYILVKSSEQALKDLAEYYRSRLTIPIVGITGSVGKTSTKEMIASVLAQKYHVLKTEGNFNNEIGMPLTLLRIRPEHEAAVVEMGIDHFGEMHRLAKVARPDICVMTNIGPCHLENLGDLDGVLKAKSEIFDFLKPDGAIVLNGNDPKLSLIGEPSGVKPMRYFVEAEEDSGPDHEYFVRARSVKNNGLHGMEADLAFSDGRCIHVTEPLPGTHHIYNACAAACVAARLGLTEQEIIAGIASAQTIAGRSNRIDLADDICLIDDCYNANPVSMRTSMDVLALSKGRTIAVLGDMGELGADEVNLHREVGAYVKEKQIDLLYCTGDLSKHLAEAAGGGHTQVFWFDSREELLNALKPAIRSEDTILVKASHFMNFTDVVNQLKEYSH